MSQKLPERADMRQLRTQAKELLRSLQSGEYPAEGSTKAEPKLADAQLLIARRYGFESWPKLVDQVEKPALLERLKAAIESGDGIALDRLLRSKPSLRKHLNEPMFSFDSQPLLQASRHKKSADLLRVLVRYGADPNVRSKWWAGGFSALDIAPAHSVDVLLELGAKFDVWSAAAHGRLDVLSALLDADPMLVNAPGGDGQRPLHVASTVEVANLLLARGADVEVRDVDHESTPIQYQINRKDIVRVLLEHGAFPDIFTAVILDDVEQLRKILRDDPEAANAHVGLAPFVTNSSDGGHIYAYTLGPKKSPLMVAAERQSNAVFEELSKAVSAPERLVAAAWQGDRNTVESILRSSPDLPQLGAGGSAVAHAAQAGRTETVQLLLEAGFDPTAPGMDSGTALHVACWYGYPDVVRVLLGKVPVDALDRNHGSSPLGWALHGANWCRNVAGDYPLVVKLLLEAGASVDIPANSNGDTMIKQAGSREDLKMLLRQYSVQN